MGLYDFTVYDLIVRSAHGHADATAWVEAEDGRRMTFAQFKTSVDRLAAGLQRIGLNKGDRIGIVGQNSLEYFLLYGAAAALGAIVLPVNWRLSADEMVFNLEDGSPDVVFADAAFQASITEAGGARDGGRRYFNLTPGKGRFADITDLMDSPASFKPVDTAADDGFVIIHTAAVAGRPRGALLSHANLVCASLTLNYCFSLTPRDVHLNLLPLFHVGGLFMAFSSFHAGAQNIDMAKFDAHRAAQLIEAHGVSLLFEFAPILSSILDAQQALGTDIGSLKAVMGLDAPETIERYQKLSGGRFYVIYGQTETSCVATMGRYDACPGAAGRPAPFTRIELVDEYDRPVSPGQVGEITVKGPMVFKGYWNLTADTDHTFRDGWHHTGDLGMFDDQGFLWYKGRKAEKELIKPGGENVYPAEVEKVILLHPAVEETVVFGVPDPKWKEGIKAVCRLAAGKTLAPDELIRFVGERIARYKKPRYVEFVAELPHQEDGAVDREKVKALYGAGV